MPLEDLRPQATAHDPNTFPTSGEGVVVYRDASGNTQEAKVLSPGTTSGLKLQVGGYGAGNKRVLDDVPLATNMKSTSAYFNRQPKGN